MVKYVIVAFRTDDPNSVLYAKVKTEAGLVANVITAFREKDAHFISIRKIGGLRAND